MYLNWKRGRSCIDVLPPPPPIIVKGPTPVFWSELPADVIANILGRLWERDLFSLKLVSKDWNFVISRFCIPRISPPSPFAPVWGFLCFEDALTSPPGDADKLLQLIFLSIGEYSLEVDKPRLCKHLPTIKDRILSLLPSDERDPADIQDCCNGVILFASHSQYHVGNPVTKQRLSVPANPHHLTSTKTIRSSLVFDPSLFLSYNKDPFFKIVTFIRPAQDASGNHPMEVDIFCSEKSEWSSHVIVLDQPCYGFEWLQRSVYFNRVLYSLSKAMYLVCIHNIVPIPGSKHSDLTASSIQLPDIKNDDHIPTPTPGCIGNSCERFYYSNRNLEGSSILVWMLENSKWVLMHNISIRGNDFGEGTILMNKVRHHARLDCFRPRAFLPNNEDLIYIATPEFVITYHVKTKTTRDIHVPLPCMPHRRRRTIKVDGNWIFPFSPCLLPFNIAAGTTPNLGA